MARVLLLDDEPAIRYVLSEFLTEVGLETVVAGSGQEALQKLATEAPIDVMAIDLLMRGMSGIEFLRRVRAVDDWAAIPAILMTGAVYSPKIFPPRESYQVLLQKPFKLSQVLDVVQGLLGEPSTARRG